MLSFFLLLTACTPTSDKPEAVDNIETEATESTSKEEETITDSQTETGTETVTETETGTETVTETETESMIDRFPRSTIAFAQEDPLYPFTGSYDQYGVDMAAWIFLPASVKQSTDTTDYREMLKIHQQGDKYTSARIEWDVVWWGMTTLYPESYTEAAVRNFDGEEIYYPWNTEHFWFCSHQDLFDEYVHWEIKEQALAHGVRPDMLMLDSQTSTSMTYSYGGCFCDRCMNDFRSWMGENYNGEELEGLGISHIDDWDYHQHLIDHGYDRSSYETSVAVWPNDVPLAEDYRHFQSEWLSEYIQELINYAKAEGGPDYDPAVGSSSPIWEDAWPGTRTLFDVPDLSHYVFELHHDAYDEKVPTNPILVYRMGDVFKRQVFVTGEPQRDWAYMFSKNKRSLLRSWIALAYANGAHFLVPISQWAGGNQFYSSNPEDHADLYQFIQKHAFLYDDMRTVSSTGIVYVNTAVRNNSQNIHLAVDHLLAQNIPFHLLIAGDDWWDRRLDDGQLDDTKIIVLTGDEDSLDETQHTFLNSHSDQLISWSEAESLPRQITLGSGADNEDIWVFPRSNPSDPQAPWVIHLVNTSLLIDGDQDSVQSHQNFSLTIHKDLFGGVPLSVIYHDLDGSDTVLSFTEGEDDYQLSIPQLNSYGVLELSTTGIAGSVTVPIQYIHPWESFDDSLEPENPFYLDAVGDNNEGIYRFGSGWAWGGYTGNQDWGGIQQNTQWSGVCQFQNGAKTGSRIYTRFDQNSEPPGEGANVPSSIYDLTMDGATFALGVTMTDEQQDWAFLIRDNQGWWQSNPITIPPLSWNPQRALYTAISELSWIEIDPLTEAVMDMDQVDDGGESLLTVGTHTNPNLCMVEGMGLMALEDGYSQWTLSFIGLAYVQNSACEE